MNAEESEPSARLDCPAFARWLVELLVCVAVLAWRIKVRQPGDLWRDWLLVICLFHAFTMLPGGSKYHFKGALVVAGYLAIIYVFGNAPLVLGRLNGPVETKAADSVGDPW